MLIWRNMPDLFLQRTAARPLINCLYIIRTRNTSKFARHIMALLIDEGNRRNKLLYTDNNYL